LINFLTVSFIEAEYRSSSELDSSGANW